MPWARWWRWPSGRASRLNQLTLAELRSVERKFGPDALKVFDLKRALAARAGSRARRAPAEVRKQLARWNESWAQAKRRAARFGGG